MNNETVGHIYYEILVSFKNMKLWHLKLNKYNKNYTEEVTKTQKDKYSLLFVDPNLHL